MTNTIQNINEICNRYANALILSLPNENDLKKIIIDFKHFRKVLNDSKEFSRYLRNPLINSNKKSHALNKICKAFSYSTTFQGFLTVLTKHGKVLLHDKIFDQFNKIIDSKKGLTEIYITTSEPLQKDFEEEIKKKLSDSLNLKIKLTKIIDKEIIGGIIIKIKSIMIDNSIRSKLVEFKV